MSVDEKKVFGPVILLLIFAAIFSFWPQSKVLELEATESKPPTLTDSLHQVYDGLRSASIQENEKVVKKLLDPKEAAKLKRIARKFGHKNIGSYLASRMRKWPNLDTLTFDDIHLGNNYARLSFSHEYKPVGERRERMLYTFILFHRGSKQWQYVTMTMIEKERYDLYGYKRDVYETDLPPVLRFPRII